MPTQFAVGPQEANAAGGDAKSYLSNSYPYTDSARLRVAVAALRASAGETPQSFRVQQADLYWDGDLMPFVPASYKHRSYHQHNA